MVKQLIATNVQTGMTIVQRYIDGIRYMKVTPRNLMPLIISKLREQFRDKVEVIESENGWIKIEKTKEFQADEGMQEAVQKLLKPDKEVDENYILNKEATMLRQQGFQVVIKEIKGGE